MPDQPLGNCNLKLIPQTVGVRFAAFQTDGAFYNNYDAILANFNSTRGQPDDPYLKLNTLEAEIEVTFLYKDRRGASEEIATWRFDGFDAKCRIRKMIDLYCNTDYVNPYFGNTQDHDFLLWDMLSTFGVDLYISSVFGIILEFNIMKTVSGLNKQEILHGIFLSDNLGFTPTPDGLEEISGSMLWGAPMVVYG